MFWGGREKRYTGELFSIPLWFSPYFLTMETESSKKKDGQVTAKNCTEILQHRKQSSVVQGNTETV